MTSHFDRGLIVTAMKENDFDQVAAAKVVGCSRHTITRQMQLAAKDEGKPYVNQRVRGQRMAGKQQIRWNDAAITKLTAILARVPRPPHAEIAFEMGVATPALQTAFSRIGLTPCDRFDMQQRNWEQKPRGSTQRRMRRCMCCRKPFGSSGINNRLCTTCKEEA